MRIEDELNQAVKLADLLDRVAAALEVMHDDRAPSIAELDEIIRKLERIIELREEVRHLP